MKTLLLVFTILFAVTSNIFAEDIFIRAGNRPGNENDIRLISSDHQKTKIEVNISGFYNKRTDLAGNTYDNIYLKDFVSLGDAGRAALPTITKLIAIPNFKDVKIVINNSEYRVMESYDIIPYQIPALRNTKGVSDIFQKDDAYYLSNKNYPDNDNIVSIKEIAVMRDYRVAVVTINPIQYNPSTKQIKVFSNINFELRYEGYSGVNNVSYVSQGISKSFQAMYKEVIFNYAEDISRFTVAPNMIIIVADSLYNNILPLANWKTKKGIKTVVKKQSEIAGTNYPTSQQIKDYLIAQYNSPDRPEFVLLAGDAIGNNTITWFNATGGKSDHPYQCLDGPDVLPEIVVGRISVQSIAELDKAVEKLIQYEKQPNMTETDWYKRAFVLHSNDGIDPINGQVAKNVFLNEGGFTSVDIANPSTTQNQITGYLNGGVSWVCL